MRGDPNQWHGDWPTIAKINRQVTLAMRHADKPCLGGECDLDYPCKRHERTGSVVSEACVWIEQQEYDSDAWGTGCGNLHQFMEGGPDENDYSFCPYCGREIEGKEET